MDPKVHSDTFVFCSFSDFSLPSSLKPICTFSEVEGLTAVVSKEQAQRLKLDFHAEFALITLSVHSSLIAVGFLAHVCSALAACDIPCNVMSGFYHDHIFVPNDLVADALSALDRITATA